MGSMAEHTEHHRITAEEGWVYRINDRGWAIYQDPQTFLWHTHSQAISIIAGRAVPDPVRGVNGVNFKQQ
jgi:hypothetical protein